jgi:hypothetical protein
MLTSGGSARTHMKLGTAYAQEFFGHKSSLLRLSSQVFFFRIERQQHLNDHEI